MVSCLYKGKEIDDVITEAQEKIGIGVMFEETDAYEFLNKLIDNCIDFFMWYCDYVDDYVVCHDREEVLQTAYRQITDESGMCEVYIMYNTERQE